MSGRIHLKDRYGNDLIFHNGGDIWCPTFPDVDDYRQHLKNLRHLEMREDDVITAGYPRSGNHWLNQIAHMLLQGTTEYTGFFSDDLLDNESIEKLPTPDKPRLFASHLRFHHLPQQVKEKGVKVIYIYRNPKDVWTSLYNFVSGLKSVLDPFGGQWFHFFDLLMEVGYWYGDWFDHVLDWEREAATNPNIFLLNYELLKRDPEGQITKLDQFLGLHRGPDVCQQIAEACSFSTLKVAKDAQVPEKNKKNWKQGVSGTYRKGEVGDWKNRFTVAQSEKFDVMFNRRMSGSQLRFSFV